MTSPATVLCGLLLLFISGTGGGVEGMCDWDCDCPMAASFMLRSDQRLNRRGWHPLLCSFRLQDRCVAYRRTGIGCHTLCLPLSLSLSLCSRTIGLLVIPSG